MNKKTHRILAQSLLLPKKDRKELAAALQENIDESSSSCTSSDLSILRLIIDELVEDTDKTARRRRRNDLDVPELWRSFHYLRQGYQLDTSAIDRHDHWQGGAPKHKGAVCPSCDQPVRLLWDINCSDARFRKESPQVFGKLKRLPLYYCLNCPYPTIYRCTGTQRVKMIPASAADSSESSFSNFPDVFPRKRIAFGTIPPEIENLLLIRQLLGEEWLRTNHRHLLADYFHSRPSPSGNSSIRRSQFGGVPILQQDRPKLMCPNDTCPTHTWGHPIVRNSRYYQMKLLATIEQDTGFEMESHDAQIVFYICWACQTIHGDCQSD